MTWTVVVLVLLLLAGILLFLVIYLVRNNKLQKKMDYLHELFDSHFKTTDITILDTRKQRDFWMKVAKKQEEQLKKSS